jgi:predicted ATPase/DNA-binding SARP family transcriptional activator
MTSGDAATMPSGCHAGGEIVVAHARRDGKAALVEDRGVVELRVLGPVEVLVRGVPKPLAGPRQRMLLAALVLASGQEMSSDQLCELLWGDEQPLHPVPALRSQVARLRRTIGEDLVDIQFGAVGYRLSVGQGCADVDRFEALARSVDGATGADALVAIGAALALWRGADLEFSDRQLLQPAAVRLVERRVSLIEHRADVLLALGHVAEAVVELQALLTAQPEREAARALLMEALYRTGRHTDALAEYRSWCDELRNRGLEPSQRLRDMESRILRHEIPDHGPGDASRRLGTRPPRPPASSLVGRAEDLEMITERLRRERMVTLTGPGGVGKTRLARELVVRAADDHSGGIVYCDLSAVRDRVDAPRVVAAAVGAKDMVGRSIEDQIVDRLADRHALLVIDNCEHVLDAVSTLTARLLEETPTLTILATSQQRLGLDGEQVWPVTPLGTADIDAPGVRLFLDRAASAAPRPHSTEADLERIRGICARVDGLPLGIEIAAAHTSALSLEDLDRELKYHLELPAPGAPPGSRHGSLRAMVEWSYDRLDEVERRVLDRLSVFAGTFDLDAARAVLDDLIATDAVAIHVIQLVGRSLLSFEHHDEHGRYRLLHVIRSHGRERLRARGELAAAQARHARWAVELAEAANSEMAHNERASVHRLDEHFDDLRAAHHWLVAYEPDGAMRLVHALHQFAFMYGRAEVFRWAEVVVALDSHSPLRSSVAASVCAGAWLRGDLRAAEQAGQAAVNAALDLTVPSARRALEQLGELALLEGDGARAVDMYDQAYRLSIDAGDILQATWDLGSSALALVYSGHADEAHERATAAVEAAGRCASPTANAFAHFVLGELMASEQPAKARAELERSIQLSRSVGNHFIASMAEVALGSIAIDELEDVADAVAHYRAAISNWDRCGMWTPQWVTLRHIVILFVSAGAVEEAAVLYGAVAAAAAKASPIYGHDKTRLDAIHEKLEAQLGAQQLAELTERGRALNPNAVVQYTLEHLTDLAEA